MMTSKHYRMISIKALPNDANPVTSDDEDTAWKQVYEGIKDVINELRRTFIPKLEFIKEMEETDFAAQQHVKLQDVFVFPTLSCYPLQANEGQLRREIIKDQTELLAKKYLLIHGKEMSGKTALGRHIFLSLVDMSTPVLHINLERIPRKPDEKVFKDAYCSQFSGDYFLWKQQKDKVLILDNLSEAPHLINFIEFAKGSFDKIVITLPSNIFDSYFWDETRLADFHQVKIELLNYNQQEELIRKRLALSDRDEPISDGLIDQIEDRINSIIISKKIVPRYPFFVLSILQLYEGFMPDNLSITSYGHCYKVLILANLRKAGIPSEDNAINTCFNFAERLAFKIYQDTKLHDLTELDFDGFVKKYKKNFIIPDSILSRLSENDYGIITSDGSFRSPYMYYFFLGRFLSRETEKNKDIIAEMCEQSYVSSNYLTLLFVIHHTNDNEIIDDILLRTMCTLDKLKPAKLNEPETGNFKDIVDKLPKNILSSHSVKKERKKERLIRDINEDIGETEDNLEKPISENPFDDIYKILKNNEIMGQILRNKYGSLEKRKIKEIIETVADSGLRLVRFLILDNKSITRVACYIHEKHPNHNIEEIKKIIRFCSFLWTMENIEKIVNSINVPEIREIVSEIVQQKSTPAYDLIGYFNHLDSIEELTNGIKQELETLLKKHDDFFLQKVLSLETQYYMNTHRSKAHIAQSVCSVLGIKYIHNPLNRLTSGNK